MESEGTTRRVGIIPIVVGSLGLLAAILSFSAEASRVTEEYVTSCAHVKYPPNGLAIGAAAILLVTQIAATVWGGYASRGGSFVAPSFRNAKTKAVAAYLASSWLAFIVGFSLLIYGTSMNGKERIEYNDYDGTFTTYCPTVKPGILGAGGALFVVTTGLLVAYLLATQAGLTSTDATIDQQKTEMGSAKNATIDFNHTQNMPQLGPEA